MSMGTPTIEARVSSTGVALDTAFEQHPYFAPTVGVYSRIATAYNERYNGVVSPPEFTAQLWPEFTRLRTEIDGFVEASGDDAWRAHARNKVVACAAARRSWLRTILTSELRARLEADHAKTREALRASFHHTEQCISDGVVATPSEIETARLRRDAAQVGLDRQVALLAQMRRNLQAEEDAAGVRESERLSALRTMDNFLARTERAEEHIRRELGRDGTNDEINALAAQFLDQEDRAVPAHSVVRIAHARAKFEERRRYALVRISECRDTFERLRTECAQIEAQGRVDWTPVERARAARNHYDATVARLDRENREQIATALKDLTTEINRQRL